MSIADGLAFGLGWLLAQAAIPLAVLACCLAFMAGWYLYEYIKRALKRILK